MNPAAIAGFLCLAGFQAVRDLESLMTDVTLSLESILREILSIGVTRRLTQNQDRRIAHFTETLVRRIRPVVEKGRGATFEQKLEVAQFVSCLERVQSVANFVKTHRGNPLLSEVNAYDRFGEDIAWVFERMTHWTGDGRMLESVIADVSQKLEFLDVNKYSQFLRDSFFTPEEIELIHKDGLLD